MARQNEIVILGASIAGLSASHYFLKHILPVLKSKGDGNYHVTLIDSSSHFFWRIASPRGMVSKSLIPDSKTFVPITDGFKQYAAADFSFIQATATAWDTRARTVTIDLVGSGETKTIPYYALIVATGTRTPTTLTSVHGDHRATQQALAEMNKKLTTATSIIVGGGGPAGVEVAGEIGCQLNGQAGWFSSRPSHQKANVTLYSGSDKLLPILRPALAKQAEVYLGKVGVDVVHHVRVTGAEPQKDGTTLVRLSNGKEKVVDVYIPAVGVTPNTEFVPEELKNERGYIQNNHQTLRIDEAGPRVYALGDVASYTRGGAMDLFDAVPVIMTNVKSDLLASSAADEKSQPKVQDRIFVPNLKESQLVPVGRNKGVGAVFGWRLPSIMVWMIKGRDYMTPQALVSVNGTKWEKESKWNPRNG
ncbi:MAG: hypothetical protein M1821_003151 [Bathelium mastoideum]|nr:MAG: hypothetical protein M1821_003151 [Bathelium mastoideum]KAI9688171.1 MAG: hypothetical protein M1822_001677 [Bathelium mastoideum]